MKTTIEMAREAAGDDWGLFQEFMPEIHRLVELVRADERARMAEQPAQQEPEFFAHSVVQPYDWSEWVCPDPKGYLMKCCDCGLVHEAEFAVVRYKSENEREDCDMVDDPNLQAVFRMRRSEQWSPADTAHRAGGLPMEMPAQQEPIHVPVTDNTYGYAKSLAEAIFKQHFASDEHYASGRVVWGVNDTVIGILTQIDNMVADMVRKPSQQQPVAVVSGYYGGQCVILPIDPARIFNSNTALYTSPPQRKPLTDEEIESINVKFAGSRDLARLFARAIEAAHGIKENT